MRLVDLYEDRKIPVGLTSDQFDALGLPNATNVSKAYKVKSVAFDNRHGLGAVPYNEDIMFVGFSAMIHPSDFLSLASKADRDIDAMSIADSIKRNVPIAAPFLRIEFKSDGSIAQILSHEGRGRMNAIIKVQGDMPVPVHFIMVGARAKNLSHEFFDSIKSDGIIPEESKTPLKVNFGKIFWMGEEI